MSRNAAFYLQASVIISFLAGSSAPTPLYAVYQAAWGFSAITTTLVFGVYALAVLGALLVLGSLSDYVGRRPVIFAAALVQAASMLVFATAHGVGALLLARVLQGVATGAAAGAVGAGMLDIDRVRGTVANAVGPMLGTALGGITSGLLVQYLPAPTTLVYVTLAVVFVVQAVGVVLMPESVTPRTGALASLRPHFALPAAVRRPLLLAAPAVVGAWALAGFYASLGPSLVRRLAGSTSLSLGGLALFALAGSGAISVLLARSRSALELMRAGTLGLIAGVGLTLVAVSEASLSGFFLGTAIAGAGFGRAFQGAVRSVLPLARSHERAGVLSVVYVIAYLALGAPAVLAGMLVVYGGGVLPTARDYGVFVMLLAALAWLGTASQRAPDPVSTASAPLPSRP